MDDPSQPQSPAGWYRDPEAPAAAPVLRWWDGARWTEHRQQVQAALPAKTSGFAIASLVFGLLGGPLLGFVFGFVARRRIARSEGTLTGKGLATAGLILSGVWTALIALVVVLALTGVLDEDPDATRFTGEERTVVTVIDSFEDALEDERFTEACGELLTPTFRDAVAEGGGKSCEKLFEDEVGGEIQAAIEVKNVTINGDRAVVTATEGGDRRRFGLTRTSRIWRINTID